MMMNQARPMGNGMGPGGVPQIGPAQMNQMKQQLLQNFTTQQNAHRQQNPMGWQAQMPPTDRLSCLLQLATSIALANGSPNIQPLHVKQTMPVENQKFQQSPDKQTYVMQIRQTIQTLNSQRQQNAQNAMGQMGQMGGQMPNMQPNMAPAAQMQPNGGNQQFQQPSFNNPQLGQPMQASPLVNNAQAFANGMNPQMQNQGMNMQQQNMLGNAANQMPPEIRQSIEQAARRQLESLPPDQVEKINASVRSLPPQDQHRVMQAGGMAMFKIREHMQKTYMEKMRARNGTPNQQQMNQMAANNAAANMQRSASQLHNAQNANNPNFDIAQFTGQQADAMRSQDAGQLVVPASNNNNGLNAQQLRGLQMNMNQNGGMNFQNFPGNNQMPNAIRQGGIINPAQAAQQAQQMQQKIRQQQANRQGQGPGQMPGMNQGNQQQNQLNLLTSPLNGQQQQNQQQQGGATPARPPSAIQMPGQNGQLNAQALQALQAQAQARANINGQGGQFGQQRQLPAHLLGLPENIQATLRTLPEEHYKLMVATYEKDGLGGLIGGAQSLNAQNIMANAGMHGQNPSLATLQQAQGMAQNTMAQNVLNGSVGAGPQAAALAAQQQRAAMPQMPQIPPQMLAKMDALAFPPSVLGANNMQRFPQNLRTWGELKQFVAANPTQVPPNVNAASITHIQLRVLKQQPNALNQQGQTPGGGIMQQPGAAPTAQMNPSLGGLQRPQQMNPQGIPAHIMPTQQEMMMARAKAGQNVSDDQLRKMVMHQKMQAFMRNNGQQQQQANPMQPGQQGFPANPGAALQQALQLQNRMNQQNQQNQALQNRQGQQARPGMPTQQPTLHQNGNNQVQRPSQPPQTPQQQLGKRPHQGDDVVEISKPAGATAQGQAATQNRPQSRTQMGPGAQQQQQQQQGQQQQQQQQGQQQQQQQQQQQANQAQNNQWTQRVQQILREVSSSAQSAGQMRPVPPPIKEKLAIMLREVVQPLQKLDQLVHMAGSAQVKEQNTENLVRQVLTAKFIILRNVNTQTMTINDTISVEPEHLGKAMDFCKRFVHGMMNRMKAQSQVSGQQQAKQQQQQQPGQQQVPGQQGQQAPSGPLQLSQSNLIAHTTQQQNQRRQQPQQGAQQQGQQGQQQQQQQQNNQKAPAAPTAGPGQMPFSFAPSPRGTPAYATQHSNFSADKLKMPLKKKQKTTASAESTPAHATPGGSMASPPRSVVAMSPEQVKRTALPHQQQQQQQQSQQQQQRPAEPAKPVLAFKCTEDGCLGAFESEQHLQAHREKTHIKDHLLFAVEAMGKALGFNADGTRKEGFGGQKNGKLSTEAGAKLAVKGAAALKVEGASPVAAAMSRSSTQQGGKPGSAVPTKSTAAAAAAANSNKAGKSAGKSASSPVLPSTEEADPWTGCSITSTDLVELLKPYDSLSASAEWANLPSGFGFTSPEPTTAPGAKDKTSTSKTNSSGSQSANKDRAASTATPSPAMSKGGVSETETEATDVGLMDDMAGASFPAKGPAELFGFAASNTQAAGAATTAPGDADADPFSASGIMAALSPSDAALFGELFGSLPDEEGGQMGKSGNAGAEGAAAVAGGGGEQPFPWDDWEAVAGPGASGFGNAVPGWGGEEGGMGLEGLFE